MLIEDTRELQCAAPNLVALRTKDGAASLSGSRPVLVAAAHFLLVRSSMRTFGWFKSE